MFKQLLCVKIGTVSYGFHSGMFPLKSGPCHHLPASPKEASNHLPPALQSMHHSSIVHATRMQRASIVSTNSRALTCSPGTCKAPAWPLHRSMRAEDARPSQRMHTWHGGRASWEASCLIHALRRCESEKKQQRPSTAWACHTPSAAPDLTSPCRCCSACIAHCMVSVALSSAPACYHQRCEP